MSPGSRATTVVKQVSIAGNPAFGLRRRRVSERPTPTITGRNPSEKHAQQTQAVTKSVSPPGPLIQRPATTDGNLRRRANSCVVKLAFGGCENPSKVDEATRVEKARVGLGKSAEGNSMFLEDRLAAPPTERDATVDRGDRQASFALSCPIKSSVEKTHYTPHYKLRNARKGQLCFVVDSPQQSAAPALAVALLQ